MYRRIVVGTDGSATAGGAVQHAVSLAKATGATLHVVTAYRTFEALPMPPEAMMAAARQTSDDSVEAAAVARQAAALAEQASVPVETHAVPGDPADALIDVAEAVKADVIVVGNRGMTTKSRFLLGSVPNKVSHHAPCSVTIVRTT